MKQIDYKLLFIILAMIVFGMIMVSSVSVFGSEKITQMRVDAGLIAESYNYYYALKNIIQVILSLFLMAVVVKIPYQFFEKYNKVFILIGILLMVYVLFAGEIYGGAKGWISIPLIGFLIQPTEFLKLATILYFASFFKKYKNYLHTYSDGFIPFVVMLGVILGLVAMQPDFGTIIILGSVVFIMYFVAGANIKHLGIMFLLGVMLLGGVYTLGSSAAKDGGRNTFTYISERIDNFLLDQKEELENTSIVKLDQNQQAIITIGSGGLMGLGFGNSYQKFGYLPEAQGDFIFAVIVEELGFVGALVLISLYAGIGYRGFRIARLVDDLFAKYTAIGISSWILIQAAVHIGVNLHILPNTGITLPFISYGGSSLMSLCIATGILLSISRNTNTGSKKVLRYKRKR